MEKEIQKLRDEFNKKLDELKNLIQDNKIEKKVKEKYAFTKIGDLEWSEPLGEMPWEEATKKCEEMGGRLPTRLELLNLVDNHSEEIEDWDKYNSLWSATTRSNNTQAAWLTYLYTGYTTSHAKTNSYDSRCVR